MIERTNAFKVGTQSFLTLADAQRYELSQMLAHLTPEELTVDKIVEYLMGNKLKVVDILTTTLSSKVRARKINGGTKRKDKKEVENPPMS